MFDVENELVSEDEIRSYREKRERLREAAKLQFCE